MHIGLAGPIASANIEKILKLENGTLPECLGGNGIPMLADGLLQEGHEISIYTLSINVKSHLRYTNGKCTVHIGHYRPAHRAWDLFKKEILEIQKMVNKDPPDIVHAHWSYEFAMGALNSGVPTLVTLHDWAPAILRLFRDHYRLACLILNNKVFAKAKHITANSAYIKELAEAKLKRNVPVIPNVLDDSLLLNSKKNWPIGKKRIISINNGFSKLKNVKTLLQAFSIISSDLNTELLLAGHDFESGGVANVWAEKNGLNLKNVFYVGHVSFEKLIGLYDNADLLIHPSLEESFGLTLAEAMCRKLPVIGGKNSGAVPWVLDYGKAGLLVDVKSATEIADNAISVLSDKCLWETYSEAGYLNVSKRFRLSEVVKLCICEYEKLLFKNNDERVY
jgi:glycosyltransferase involved in cell wall biosynthesis